MGRKGNKTALRRYGGRSQGCMKPREKNSTSLWQTKEEQSDEEKVRKAKSALCCYERGGPFPENTRSRCGVNGANSYSNSQLQKCAPFTVLSSDINLMRADTTLDRSQKAGKRFFPVIPEPLFQSYFLLHLINDVLL